MKFVVVLAGLLAVAAVATADPEEWAEIKSAMKDCFSEAGVEMPKEKPKGPPPAEIQEKLKCVDSCIIKKLDAINADGTFNTDKIPASHKEKAQKCFDDNKDKEECERAREIKKCMFKH